VFKNKQNIINYNYCFSERFVINLGFQLFEQKFNFMWLLIGWFDCLIDLSIVYIFYLCIYVNVGLFIYLFIVESKILFVYRREIVSDEKSRIYLFVHLFLHLFIDR